jgi:hypothetical protein
MTYKDHITVGNVTDSYAAIGKGAQVIANQIQQALSAVDESVVVQTMREKMQPSRLTVLQSEQEIIFEEYCSSVRFASRADLGQ